MVTNHRNRDRRKQWIYRFCVAIAVLSAGLISACQDGHISILGYTTRPNYDPNIQTVKINIFRNDTYYRGLEFEVAEALQHAIESKTPLKVVGPDAQADTELSGTIKSYTKNVLNRTQQNGLREAEMVLEAQVVWKDLRTGEVLSSPSRGLITPPTPAIDPLQGGTPGQPSGPLPLPAPIGQPTSPTAPPPTTVNSLATIIPELGVSNAAARKRNADRLAEQIISMMEEPWRLQRR